MITARQQNHIPELLSAYRLPFINKGKGSATLWGKGIGLFREIFFLLRKIRIYQPELILSFASPYASIAGKLSGKRVITFDDTEADPLLHLFFPPFSDWIITPACYGKSFGNKHLRFKGYKESAYIQPPIDSETTTNPMSNPATKMILVRFVSHKTTHDLGQQGMTEQDKIRLITTLSAEARVFISSEEALPEALKSYQLHIPPENIHRFMAAAGLFIGESTTMAAEAALSGVPAIVVTNTYRGYIQDLQDTYNLVHRYKGNQWKEVIQDALHILHEGSPVSNPGTVAQTIRKQSTDIQAFLEWIADHFPDSLRELRKNPGIINDF